MGALSRASGDNKTERVDSEPAGYVQGFGTAYLYVDLGRPKFTDYAAIRALEDPRLSAACARAELRDLVRRDVQARDSPDEPRHIRPSRPPTT